MSFERGYGQRPDPRGDRMVYLQTTSPVDILGEISKKNPGKPRDFSLHFSEQMQIFPMMAKGHEPEIAQAASVCMATLDVMPEVSQTDKTFTKNQVLTGLARIDHASIQVELARHLRDSDDGVRLTATRLLKENAGKHTHNELFDYLLEQPDEQLKGLALWIIENNESAAVPMPHSVETALFNRMQPSQHTDESEGTIPLTEAPPPDNNTDEDVLNAAIMTATLANRARKSGFSIEPALAELASEVLSHKITMETEAALQPENFATQLDNAAGSNFQDAYKTAIGAVSEKQNEGGHITADGRRKIAEIVAGFPVKTPFETQLESAVKAYASLKDGSKEDDILTTYRLLAAGLREKTRVELTARILSYIDKTEAVRSKEAAERQRAELARTEALMRKKMEREKAAQALIAEEKEAGRNGIIFLRQKGIV